MDIVVAFLKDLSFGQILGASIIIGGILFSIYLRVQHSREHKRVAHDSFIEELGLGAEGLTRFARLPTGRK